MPYPLVSICIPCYNHADYITQTLDSILLDTYPNKEIVIIDDGSSDNSVDIIQTWIEHHLQVPVKFKHRKNKGLSKTLNELLKLSEGEYITFLASDDLLLSDGIMKRYHYLQSHLDKKAVFGDCIVIDDNGKKLYDSGLFQYRKANLKNLRSNAGLKKEFITNFALPGSIFMMHKDIFQKHCIYFDETMFIEDLDFLLQIAAKEMVGFLEDKVSAYRIHKENMSLATSSHFLKILIDSRKTLIRNLSLYDGINHFHIWKQIAKFTIRICLYRFDLMKKRVTEFISRVIFKNKEDI